MVKKKFLSEEKLPSRIIRVTKTLEPEKVKLPCVTTVWPRLLLVIHP